MVNYQTARLILVNEKTLPHTILNFIFIIGYLGDKIQDYVKAKYPGLNCHFIQQSERYGTGHAVDLTKEIVGDDEVLIVLGDTIA